MKVGIDTNVLLYFLDKDNKFHQESRDNLLNLVRNGLAVLTQQNLTELISVLTKRGVKVNDSINYARNFSESIPVVTPNPNTLNIFYQLLQEKTSYRVKSI